ncbi:MAG: hypothetical protein J1E81_00585 [Eubacterium sp.]|nr:hypothetical protein [Eubacterium sp.]
MYLYDGLIRDGLHMRIDDNGKLERVLSVDGKHIELPDVNLVDEILSIAETDDSNYVIAMNYLNTVYKEFESTEGLEDGAKVFDNFLRSVDVIVEGLIESIPVLGYLMRQTIQMKWYEEYELTFLEKVNGVIDMFHHYLFVSTELEFLLSDLSQSKELDFEKRCNVFKYGEITTAYTHTKNGLEQEYYITTVLEYYILLVNKFLEMNLNVQRCKCCGNFFVTKTKRKTLYCDRALYRGGKTCKDVAPKAMQKYLAKNDEIIKAYDKTKNKMYKRMQRADTFGETEKSISYDEYADWLFKAQQARNNYRNGKLSAENALKIIQID